MPELPEVEFARRNLLRWMEGRRVLGARAEDSRIFRGADRARFEALRGHLEAAERKGKYLLLRFSGGEGLLSHLGMTGKWVRRPLAAAEPYSRARLELDDGHALHFRDPRMFGRIEPVDASALWALAPIRALGIDPLTEHLTWQRLKEAVGPSTQDLKVALMDQVRVAGLGNIHAAEALFRARLNPARKPKSLTGAEWRRLAKAIDATIAFGLSDQGEDDEIAYVEEPGTENPFLIYGHAEERCRRCKQARVESFIQAGRTTFFCPHCQPRRPKR